MCPSNIPLVQYYRFAKSEIWANEREKDSADIARERHEFHLSRIQREKQDKAEKLALKEKAARAAKETATKPEADSNSDSTTIETLRAQVREIARPETEVRKE